MQAYSGFISVVRKFAFGWVNFRWMNINTAEANVLVVSAVFIAAYGRAEARNMIANGEDGPYRTSFILCAGYLLFVLIPAVLLPDPFGFYGALTVLFLILIIYFLPDDRDRKYARRSVIAAELAGSFGLLVMALIANYVFVR